MENSIVDRLNEATEIAGAKFLDDSKLKEFEAASAAFELMVQQGLTKKRGYTLMTIMDEHLHRPLVNFEGREVGNEIG